MKRKNTGSLSFMRSVRKFFKKLCAALSEVKIELPFFGGKIAFPLNCWTLLILLIILIAGSIIWSVFYNKPCVYTDAAKTDPEAISWLIENEAQAVVAEDLGLIKEIFAGDAIIVDAASQGGTPQRWVNPINRYQPLFKDYDFLEAENTNIKATGPINNDTVEYISGSQGMYTVSGQTYSYQNPDNASQWTATKINGCWKITRFEFNVSK